jgi:acetyl-CoA carboxylase biotin carboxylase subunit
MIAKLIVWAPTRDEAIARARRALSEFMIEGVKTTIPFHLKLMNHPIFVNGTFDIKFLEEHDINGEDEASISDELLA